MHLHACLYTAMLTWHCMEEVHAGAQRQPEVILSDVSSSCGRLGAGGAG
jgi:hypothetical protein